MVEPEGIILHISSHFYKLLRLILKFQSFHTKNLNSLKKNFRQILVTLIQDYEFHVSLIMLVLNFISVSYQGN